MQPVTYNSLRIGILGGSFNPAHEGHRHISLYALKLLGLDAVWWMVSPGNPLKPEKGMAPFEKRMHSAKTVARHPQIKVTDIEKKIGSVYTYKTIRELKRRYPKVQFVWLMGADNLANLHRWKYWRELMRLIPMAILDRAPFSHTALRKKAALTFARRRAPEADFGTLAAKTPPRWAYILIKKHPASATEIRKSGKW